MGLVIAAPRSEDGESFALEINLFQFLKISPSEFGIFAGLVFEFGECGCGDKQCSQRCT